VLNRHLLLSTGAVSLERLHLSSKGPGDAPGPVRVHPHIAAGAALDPLRLSLSARKSSSRNCVDS
jgi:hypothetical protein